MGDPRRSASYISFLAGFPDPASLPKGDVVEATRLALERDGEWVLQYGASRGYGRLVDELLIKLRRDQGIEATDREPADHQWRLAGARSAGSGAYATRAT